MLQAMMMSLACMAVSLGPAVVAQPTESEIRLRGPNISGEVQDWLKDELPHGAGVWVLCFDGRVYETMVMLPADTDLLALGKQAGRATTDGAQAFDSWANWLNERVLARVRELVARDKRDPDFNPELDCELSLSLPGRDGEKARPQYAKSFVGSRAVSADLDTKPEAQGEPIGGEISVVITPDRAEWNPRETIRGRVAVENKGKGRVHWSVRDHLIEVRSPDGMRPEKFNVMGCICVSPGAAMYRYLGPGERVEFPFEVVTDRSCTMAYGFFMPGGKWVLSTERLPNVKTASQPVEIRVVAKPGEYSGPRIVEVIGFGSNIGTMCEDGSIQITDARTGEIRGSRRLGHGWFAHDQGSAWSPDGELLAKRSGRDSPIRAYGLLDGQQRDQTFADPADAGSETLWPKMVSRDGKTLFCSSIGVLAEYGIAEARILKLHRFAEERIDPSPDGAHGVVARRGGTGAGGGEGKHESSLALLDLSVEPPSPREIKLPVHARAVYAGVAGAFVTVESESAALFVPYAAESPDRPFRLMKTGGPVRFVGESADGTTVAFSWGRGVIDEPPAVATTIGIFRVSDGERVCEIACLELTEAVLLESPLRVVTLPVHQRDTYEWCGERATVFDAKTGKILQALDLTPRNVLGPIK